MATAETGGPPLTFGELAGHLASGCKPKSEFRVGSEHEKFVYRLGSHEAVAYEPDPEGRGGILALLEALAAQGWSGVYEDDRYGRTLIGLSRGSANISLEPGGQFELSGAPLETIHETCAEITDHLRDAGDAAAALGIGFSALGFAPEWRREDVPIMPKGRYAIMRAYMPKVGGRGLDMMLRTCTVQANLDFSSEADMSLKFRFSLAAQPVVTALFANSPFVEGTPTGLLSNRAAVWTDTDPDRTGMLPFVFEGDFGFERYARYALDVPMYFVKRAGRYIDASGQSFRDFIDGRLPALPGERATLKDWEDHLTTLFPEVRLKTYLEMRGADTGPKGRLCALAAFWTGVFYDDAALAAAWDVCKGWSSETMARMRTDAARHGLKADAGGRSMQAVARDLVAIAREGLKRRNRLNGALLNECGYLDELEEIAETGVTPAERLLELYNGPWAGQIAPVYEATIYRP